MMQSRPFMGIHILKSCNYIFDALKATHPKTRGTLGLCQSFLLFDLSQYFVCLNLAVDFEGLDPSCNVQWT